MKKTLITILLMLSLAIPNVLFAYPPMPRGWMTLIPTDLDAIDSPADTEVPSYDSATGKFEWIASGGSGDVTSVGSVDAAGCTSGACLDGTSDGGTKILFYDAQGATTLIGGDTAGAITLTLPIVTGTIYATGNTDVAVADGGTNSSTALNNDFVMVSSGGAIVESATVTATELALLNGETDLATQAELNAVAELVNTDDEIIAIINASPSTQIGVPAGGTGAGTHTDGGILIGNGTGALVALGVASNGQIPIGDGDKDPQLANITETGDALVVTNGAGSIALSAHATLEAVADSGYTGDDAITTVGTIAAGTWQSTDIGVAYGGTGASSFTDGGILLGATTGAIEVTAAGGVGEILVGVAASNPKWLTAGTAGYHLLANGANDVVWTEPTGTGSPVNGTSPTIATPAITTPTITTSALMVNASDLRVSTTTTAHEFSIQVYDNDDTTWRDALTFTNGDSPSVTLGASVTLAGLGLIDPASGLKSLTPIAGTGAGFAAGFTGANLYGGTYRVTTAGACALPVPAAGMNFTILHEVSGASTIHPTATDTIYMNGLAAAQAEDLTASAIGASCSFKYQAANTWMALCYNFTEATPPL